MQSPPGQHQQYDVTTHLLETHVQLAPSMPKQKAAVVRKKRKQMIEEAETGLNLQMSARVSEEPEGSCHDGSQGKWDAQNRRK